MLQTSRSDRSNSHVKLTVGQCSERRTDSLPNIDWKEYKTKFQCLLGKGTTAGVAAHGSKRRGYRAEASRLQRQPLGKKTEHRTLTRGLCGQLGRCGVFGGILSPWIGKISISMLSKTAWDISEVLSCQEKHLFTRLSVAAAKWSLQWMPRR